MVVLLPQLFYQTVPKELCGIHVASCADNQKSLQKAFHPYNGQFFYWQIFSENFLNVIKPPESV